MHRDFLNYLSILYTDKLRIAENNLYIKYIMIQRFIWKPSYRVFSLSTFLHIRTKYRKSLGGEDPTGNKREL